MPLDPTLRVLLLAISRAARAFSDGDNSALKAVNESLQPLVDAAMARILAKDAEIARLRSELAAFTRPYLILDDPEGIIGCVEAASHEAAWEAFKAANPNDYRGDPADNDVVIRRITAGLYGGVVDALEIARSELAAAPEAARRWAAIREAVATVHAATGLAGDAPLTDDTVAELLTNALQNASRAHFAETALRTDAEATARTIEHHRRLFVGQQARAERAELALAAAQAGPVVEWQESIDGWLAKPGALILHVDVLRGWRLSIETEEGHYVTVDRGPETGPAGKSAAEAAYRRACGFPGQ